jgi:hypothetical protein
MNRELALAAVACLNLLLMFAFQQQGNEFVANFFSGKRNSCGGCRADYGAVEEKVTWKP